MWSTVSTLSSLRKHLAQSPVPGNGGTPIKHSKRITSYGDDVHLEVDYDFMLWDLEGTIQDHEEDIFRLTEELRNTKLELRSARNKVAVLMADGNKKNRELSKKAMLYLDIIKELEDGLAMYIAKYGVSITSNKMQKLKREAGIL